MENKHKLKNKISASGFALFGGIIFFGLPLSVISAYLLAFSNRVYPKITVCNTVLTGQNHSEVETILDQQFKDLPDKIKLSTDRESFTIEISSLNINFNKEVSLAKVFGLGREKFPLFNLNKLYSLYTKGENLNLELSLNDTKLNDEIATISAKLFQPVIEPAIKINKKSGVKTITIEQGKNGQNLDKKTLKNSILQNLSCPNKELTLAIPIFLNTPKISLPMAQSVKNRAISLLDKEIVLKLDSQTWKINDEEVIGFLSFEGGFDYEKLFSYTQSFTKTVNSSPENATFQFENNFVRTFSPSKEGIALQETEFAKNLNEKLIQAEATNQNQEMVIPVLRTAPKISTGDVNNLGIKELVGKGASLFYGSIPERIHNVQLASTRLNGLLISPGETFSFNKSLGDVSQDTGFKQAYIIKAGRTILGDGGGVCQVSTTLFRAVLNAGLPIVERQAHAYRVHYYEDDLGPGFDATVFDPNADLKFKNDTDNYLLVQSSINIKKKQLTFELYGSRDGRQVEISKARVWDKEPPPPDLYQEDPTLPAGTVKQVDWKAWGSKVAFDYKVTRNGKTLIEKTFYSTYKPWQAVYLKGTRR